jgi:hypothetical protein
MYQFDFFDIVLIQTQDPLLEEIHNLEGVLLGFSEIENETWCAVLVNKNTWMIKSTEILKTGKKAKKEEIYPESEN